MAERNAYFGWAIASVIAVLLVPAAGTGLWLALRERPASAYLAMTLPIAFAVVTITVFLGGWSSVDLARAWDGFRGVWDWRSNVTPIGFYLVIPYVIYSELQAKWFLILGGIVATTWVARAIAARKASAAPATRVEES